MMSSAWPRLSVSTLQDEGVLLVEDGNHGEYRPRRDEFGEGEHAFIRAADLDCDRVLFESAQRINSRAMARIRKGIGQGGDVLFSHKGTVGKLALAPLDSPPFVCSPQTTFWRVLDQERLDRRYLYCYMQSEAFAQQWMARCNETDMAAYISLTAQRQLNIAVPPIEEQRAIADVLGALDAKIEQNRRTTLALERLARTIFRTWFVDFEPVKAKVAGAASFPSMPQHVFESLPSRFVDSDIGPLPEGWNSGSLGDAIDIHDFRRVPLSRRERQRRKGPFRYYGATGVVDYVDDFLFDGRFVLVGEDGTVVSDHDGPVVQYVWGQFWVNNHAHVLTGAGDISTEYLRLLLDSINIRPFVTGAVQPKLSQRNLKSVPVMTPPTQAVNAFEEFIAPQFALLRQAHDESRLLESMRDLLLPPLLGGKVRVADANG